MQVLSARIEHLVTAEILDFRRSFLLAQRQELSALAARDSVHLSISHEQTILAYCRLAWGDTAPVQNNPRIKCRLEPSLKVADLIDGYVIKGFRSMGLYNLLAALAVEAAEKVGVSHLVLSASSEQGLTPVMATWPILHAGMQGINPYSDAPIDLFLVDVTPDRLAKTRALKLEQLERLQQKGFDLSEQWQVPGSVEQASCISAFPNLGGLATHTGAG